MHLRLEAETETSLEAERSRRRPPSRRAVDLVHLARYTLGNRALEREVLELFQTQSKLYLQRMKDAETEKAWRDAAHTLKGSARGIGAWRVDRAAESAETLQGFAADERMRAVAALDAALTEATTYIREILAGH